MTTKMDQFLADLEKAPQPEAAPEAAMEATPDAPVGPLDPLAHLIGHGGPIQERSPFDAFLEEATADAPEPEDRDPDYVDHDFQAVKGKEAIYEDDQDVLRCTRCFREVRVARDESISAACQKINLNLNCGLSIATQIMET